MTLSRQQDSCITVRDLFEVERRLSAPLYQRRYSWDRKNLDEFWEDVRQVEEGQSEALFLGAIILKHEGASDPSAGSLEEFLVLDGQQRIATLFLALLAVALEWQEHGHPTEATAIAETFLKSTRTTTKGKPRFFPTIPDTPEFVSLCRKLKVDWDMPSSGKFRTGRMLGALERAQSEVGERCQSKDGFDGDSLKALERVLVDKIEIAAINIAERHQPNEVFDRLNRKGQVLTVGDLVKMRFSGDSELMRGQPFGCIVSIGNPLRNRSQTENYSTTTTIPSPSRSMTMLPSPGPSERLVPTGTHCSKMKMN